MSHFILSTRHLALSFTEYCRSARKGIFMDVSGEYTFDAPQSLVWESLLDPNVLGSIMPGGKGFEKTGDNDYAGVLEVKVGPVQGTFQGQITLTDIKAP